MSVVVSKRKEPAKKDDLRAYHNQEGLLSPWAFLTLRFKVFGIGFGSWILGPMEMGWNLQDLSFPWTL